MNRRRDFGASISSSELMIIGSSLVPSSADVVSTSRVSLTLMELLVEGFAGSSLFVFLLPFEVSSVLFRFRDATLVFFRSIVVIFCFDITVSASLGDLRDANFLVNFLGFRSVRFVVVESCGDAGGGGRTSVEDGCSSFLPGLDSPVGDLGNSTPASLGGNNFTDCFSIPRSSAVNTSSGGVTSSTSDSVSESSKVINSSSDGSAADFLTVFLSVDIAVGGSDSR
mmetsp:Transcript_4582/g.17314  ORF Transcript_4582/g.17314 Transcript_4582/m.17314 type:complete len:225 (+) Transcript_4582:1214-1888(+)